MKSWIVYEHISPSGKVYVGITCQKTQHRWKGGSGYVRRDKHQEKFANAIRKYGWKNFEHKIVLENVSKEEAYYAEKYLIRWYKIHNLSYNITDGGDGGTGTKHTEETKKYLSMIHTGKKERKEDTERRIGNRIALYPYYVLAINPECIHVFKTAKEAAEKLHINSSNNISGAIAGKQCLVKGYVFVHWDKNRPIDEEYLYNLYNEKFNSRYSSERRAVG